VVLDFLDLETVRHNSARTRNARLAAIRSFMRYVAVRDPASLPITARVLAIPAKRFDRPVLGYPTREQVTAILAAPDRATWSGRRDAVLLAVAYNTGARVPELTALQVRDVLLENQSALQLHGKGRKQRGNSTRCPVSQTPPPRGPRKHGDRTPYPYVPAFQSLIKRCLTSWKQASWLIGRTRESKVVCPKNNTKLLTGCRLVAYGKRAICGLDSTTQSVELVAAEKGKPLVRGGRKTTGLPESAGSPK